MLIKKSLLIFINKKIKYKSSYFNFLYLKIKIKPDIKLKILDKKIADIVRINSFLRLFKLYSFIQIKELIIRLKINLKIKMIVENKEKKVNCFIFLFSNKFINFTSLS